MSEIIKIKIINHYQYWTPNRIKKIKVYFDKKLNLLDYDEELILETPKGEEKELTIRKWFQKIDINYQTNDDNEIVVSSNIFTGMLQISSSNNIQICVNRWQAFGNFLISGGPVFIILIIALLISLGVIK